MFRMILSRGRRLEADNANQPHRREESVSVRHVRDVATQAALVTAVDGTPTALVDLWAHDQRLHPDPIQRSPRRRAA